MTVIPLGRALLPGSSDLPGSGDAPSRHVPAVLAPQQAQNRRSPGTPPEHPQQRIIAGLPGAKERRDPPLFGLAPCGVCPATAIAGGAVRSYRTFSPLPHLIRSSPARHLPDCSAAAFGCAHGRLSAPHSGYRFSHGAGIDGQHVCRRLKPTRSLRAYGGGGP